MKIAITGHRPNKLGNDYDLTSDLIKRIKGEILDQLWMIDKDFNLTLISGMALGIDTLFAKIAIELKIPLIAAIPFRGQELKWPIKSQNVYNEILKYAFIKEYICDPGYADYKMQKRNEYMVNACDKLIAVWDGTSGGTANCINYAKSIHKDIIYINPKEL